MKRLRKSLETSTRVLRDIEEKKESEGVTIGVGVTCFEKRSPRALCHSRVTCRFSRRW